MASIKSRKKEMTANKMVTNKIQNQIKYRKKIMALQQKVISDSF